jgi:exopolysaccharide production protein ExoZ
MNRVHSVDYLRGLMALSVLFYHFFAWTIGIPDSSTVLGRLGIYAVSIFYIVSGMSMYVAYSNKKWGILEIFAYIAKRYLRLAPAFWLACFLVILLSYLTTHTLKINWSILFQNLTLTFGFTNPRAYMMAGGWSIANEMVFYLFFPLAICLASYRSYTVIAALISSLIFYIYYAFFVMDTGKDLASMWSEYIQPANQAFLFFLGVAIAWASTRFELRNFKYNRELLIVSIIIFAVYPSSGNQISIVTGFERILYTTLCGLICISIFNSTFNLNAITAKILSISGDLSYGIYILHGVFAMFTLKLLAPAIGIKSPTENLLLLIFLTMPTLIIFAYFFYSKIEKPIMQIGKKMDT